MQYSFLKKIKRNIVKKRNKHRKRKWQWAINGAVALISLFILLTGSVIVWAATINVPDFQHFDDTLISESTKIYDRTGKVLLYDVHGDVKRTVVPITKMSPNIQHATVALEDEDFYHHFGIDISATLRALLADVKSGSFSQGGSTITQQVAKNAFLSNQKSIVRKIKEAVLALKIDHEMTKDQILQIYLNIIPYGGNIYGIEEASLKYFGKHASDLDIAESAYLASLPQAPTYYLNHPKDLEWRKNYALKRMYNLGYISKTEFEKAKNEKVTFAEPADHSMRAPAFTTWVLENLEKKYGRDRIENSGLKVITTLDYALWEKAQKTVKEAALRNAKVNNANNMSMVGIDPKTGQILLMIGSADFFNDAIDGKYNVAINHNRQPGSAFKPFVYVTAFEEGYTPATVVFDLRTQFSTACGAFQTDPDGCGYAPTNYDHKFRGPISFRNALAQSVNVPAVKVLYLAGIKPVLQTATEMGIQGLKDKSQYGLTLALGAAQVSVLDMASAYGVFATGGIRNPYVSILKVTDREGNVIEQFEPSPRRVIEKQAALQISDVLTDNVARTPLYGANSPLFFGGRDVAGKTGTTNNYKDAWTVGYTKNFVLAAWAGNSNGDSMAKKVSGYIITPTWREVMDEALETYPAEEFEEPEPISQSLKPILRGIWNPGGNTNNAFDLNEPKNGDSRESLLDRILKREEQERAFNSTNDVHSILYWVDTADPRGPRPANPGSDPQYHLWEPQVRSWAEHRNGGGDEGGRDEGGDEQNDTSGIYIAEPDKNERFEKDDEIHVRIAGPRQDEVTKLSVYVNNFFVDVDTNTPFEVVFQPHNIFTIHDGENVLKVIAERKDGKITIQSQKFKVQ